jgi:hypothetical protein
MDASTVTFAGFGLMFLFGAPFVAYFSFVKAIRKMNSVGGTTTAMARVAVGGNGGGVFISSSAQYAPQVSGDDLDTSSDIGL